MSVVAAFDVDGTLVPGDSLLPFLWSLLGWRAVARSAVALPALALAQRAGGRDRAKAVLLRRVLAGVDGAEVSRVGEVTGARMARRLHPSMRRVLASHLQAGHRTVLVSASLTAYIAPLARALGVDDVLATRLEVSSDGRLTGRLDGANVRGVRKAELLAALLPAGAELWAYGNSAGDTEMLALADHPHVVRSGVPRPQPVPHRR